MSGSFFFFFLFLLVGFPSILLLGESVLFIYTSLFLSPFLFFSLLFFTFSLPALSPHHLALTHFFHSLIPPPLVSSILTPKLPPSKSTTQTNPPPPHTRLAQRRHHLPHHDQKQPGLRIYRSAASVCVPLSYHKRRIISGF